MKKIALALYLVLFALTLKAQVVGNYFSYNLSVDYAHTSACVDSSGILVRTLWEDVPQKAGRHEFYWDGKNDLGTLLSAGTYQILISTNNNQYIWEGVICNTSTVATGNNVWKGGTNPQDMVQTGSVMRVATGYSEGFPAQRKFVIGTPQQSTTYSVQPNAIGQSTIVACANSAYVFWGGWDWYGKGSFIFAETLSNEHEATFTYGTATTFPGPNRVYSSALSIGTAPITGMAVQNSGNQYLFVAYGTQNVIKVFNITAGGSLVHSITITAPGSVFVENDVNLWVSQGTTVTKYTINTDGSITPTSSQISGFSSVAGIDIFNGDLCVYDGGNQQIVKRYNSSSLAYTGTIGQTGGYANTVSISNNRFYQNDLRGTMPTFVRHQLDGSIWIGDPGNLRCQHFSSNGTFIESIMYIPLYNTYNYGLIHNPVAYNVNLDYTGSATTVFNELLEISIDYTKPIGSCWTLVNNYNYNIPANTQNINLVEAIATLSNGHRYAILNKNGAFMSELASTGIRINNVFLPQSTHFTKSGDGLSTYNITNKNPVTPPTTQPPAVTTYYKYSLTGFDGNNYPTFGPQTTVATIASGYANPIPGSSRYPTITASHKIIIFDSGTNQARDGVTPYYYNLGAWDSTTVVKKWLTRRGTYKAYIGDLPVGSGYDVGNQVNFQGGTADVLGNDIVCNDHGENWKQSQTAMVYHFDDNGLLQARVGVLGPTVTGQTAPYAYFTNALKTNLTSNNGNLYVYFNDEGAHAGMHRYKIIKNGNNLQTINFVLSSSGYTPVNTYVDLLAGVPAGNGSIQGTSGWIQSPVTDSVNRSSTTAPGQFYSTCNIGNYDASKSVTVYATPLSTNRYWKKTISSINPYWTIGGYLNLSRNSFIAFEPASLSNPTTQGQVYVEVGDNAGKVIARLYLYRTNRVSFNMTYYGPFNNPRYGSSQFVISRQGNLIYLSMNIFGQQLSATATAYDPTATISAPAYVSFNANNINAGFQMGINKLYIVY
jgi:hypothetical protein